MMNETGFRRIPPDQSSGSGHTSGTPRHPSIIDPILSKRVCFYKSGDPQFNGLRMVINNRTFKTFDALLDSLSNKVPLPFGVRNITTPRGVHAVHTLDELEDGKSYICSDSRKIKPINLALARKKLPPWYHARPASSRRRTVQKARFSHGRNLHTKEPVLMRTPKTLLVFRNGDPTVEHTVVLHKRTTPTFESILGYISELIQSHVVKLYTADGRRVDGLPGLILCSGTVVAVGKESFRHANYNAQKAPAPTMLPTKQMGHRRFKRKKKSLPYTSESRNFSTSSERFIVNRIHNSMAESHSVELGRTLESVPETPESCLGVGAEEQDSFLPADDDIEKSFRVNQDGSMTVEMRVRLTLKEEESIHWTTTLSRSSVANQLNVTCLPEPEVEQEIGTLKSNSLDLQSSATLIDSINKDKTQKDNDEDPPSMGNGAFSESGDEEDYIKAQSNVVSPRRALTPGHKQIRKKQASVESIQSMTSEGMQEDMVGSYSYREQTGNGAMTEQYCMVKQSSSRPVPKPRRLGSVDVSNTDSRNVSTFKSAGMTEVLHAESRGEEVTETVLHVYEEQTYQDNFFGNLCSQGVSASGIHFCRPATSETGQLSYNNEAEPRLWRPSTASESISIWRSESMSVTSDLTLPSLRTSAIQVTNAQRQLPKPSKGKDKHQQREVNKDKRPSSKPKVISKRGPRLMSPGKRKKKHSAGAAEKSRKVKTFSSAGFIKKIYGNKSKSAKSIMKLKKEPTENRDGGVTTKSLQESDDTIKCILEDPNIPSALEETMSETLEEGSLNVSPNEVSQPRGILTRQTSMHQQIKSHDVNGSLSLPAFNSSNSVTNKYVENWLEKAHLNPAVDPDEESKILQGAVQRENASTCGESENKNGLMIATEDVKGLEKTSEVQTLKTDPRASVKQRIQSYEINSSPPMEKTTVDQQIVHSHTNAENYSSLAQTDRVEIKPLSNHNSCEIFPPTNETSTTRPCQAENKSSPIKISLQKATLSNTPSTELPPPPPPVENTELLNTEYCLMDASSVASSPLYRLSSLSSQTSDNHPLSISPTSDKPISPTDPTTKTTTWNDIPPTQGGAPLSRTPSIKRAPLVSDTSFDMKMSLRKACMDKYTLCSDGTLETRTSSTPINVVGEKVLPNSIYSPGTLRPSETPSVETQLSNSIINLRSSPSCCTSASPISSTTEERMSPTSISSSEAPTMIGLPFKETKMDKTLFLTQKEASSPKSLVKKLMSSSSPERKSITDKFSSELPHNSPKLSSLHNHPPDKTMSPKIGKQRHATPNASPSTERKLYKPKLQRRPSPYSQSLDMSSPPIRNTSNGKLLSRNLSSDSASVPINKTKRKTSSQRKRHQTPQSTKSPELDKTLTCNTLMPLEADQSGDKNVRDDLLTADQERSITQIMPQPLNISNQPNMKPVLDKICYSIKSIRQITQNKRPSCLEKSNSLPDFSSHVASTFGASSKALLAFLSLMTLNGGLMNLNVDERSANNVSCAEALQMIDSLREIASIEDSHELTVSLANLQQSASMQLLQSWKGFQDLNDKSKSRSSTPNNSEQELVTEASPARDCGIDEIVDNLDIPEKLKEELATLSVGLKSDSDEGEKVKPEVSSNGKISHFPSTDNAINVRDVTQDEKAHVNVSSIIKKFTHINQPKQSSTDTITKDTKVMDSLYGQNGAAECPPAEQTDKQKPVEAQIYSAGLIVKDNGQQGHNKDKSNQEKLKMNGVVGGEKSLEHDCCSSEVEAQDIGSNQLQMHGEESITEKELTREDESGSDEEGQNMLSAIKDLEQKVSCEQSVSSSDTGQEQSSEDEPAVKCEEIGQESRESEGLSSPESPSEEEEENVIGKGGISSLDIQNKSLSEEEQPGKCEAGSVGLNVSVDESTSSSDGDEQSSEEEQPEVEWEAGSLGPNVSVDESSSYSDLDVQSSEEEHPEVESKKLKVIIEESLSGNEEEEEEHLDVFLDHREPAKTYRELKTLIEEAEEVSSDDEDHQICNETKSQITIEGDLSNLIEHQDPYTKKDKSSWIKSDSLTKGYGFNADEDSGNEHSSFEKHVEVEQPQVTQQQINSSNEEELSYIEEPSLEEEYANVDRYSEASVTAKQSKDTKCEDAVEKLKYQPAEIISQSVAERVILLEKQVAEAQKTTESSVIRRYSERNAPLESDIEDSPSESPTSQLTPGTRSAPQSSLSFSYDSSGVITTEPEGNRVRSIREMFLAKSATDIQHGHGRFPSPNASERSELRAGTSISGGYQSQTSSELSSGEDDSARKSITKGFVRRTIERLYGTKDAKPDEEVNERPSSASKQHSSLFSPFHKAMSELSYFNSANVLDTLSSATRVAFNAQVRPEDTFPIGNEQWLLGENTLMRKSVSDPIGINKNFTNSPQGDGMREDTEEDTPYSLFSTKSELEDKTSSFSGKCTYFSLPHASDSDACQDDLSTVSKDSVNADSMDTKDISEDTGTERNGLLPGLTDFKMMDNKVHPLMEPPPDGEVVVVQPRKGQGVVARRIQEPDVLDILYDFCGQNCPIL